MCKRQMTPGLDKSFRDRPGHNINDKVTGILCGLNEHIYAKGLYEL